MFTNHQIGISIKFLPATNTKPARVKLSLPRWENKSISFSYHNETGNDYITKSEKFLVEKNIDIKNLVDMGGFYIITCEFNQMEKIKKLFKF